MSKKQHQKEMQSEVMAEPIRYTQNPTPTPVDSFVTELKARLDWYRDEVMPGKLVDTQKGIHAQRTLWTIIKDVMSLEGVQFYTAMSALMEKIQRQRSKGGVFHEEYVFRFLDVHGSITGLERVAFERMVTVLINTCNPMSRQLNLKQIDMKTAMQHCPGDWQGKLEEYFSI